MSDTISRRAVINAHKEYCKKHPKAQWYKWSLSIMQTAPSVEPERKKGTWIEGEDDVFLCSECSGGVVLDDTLSVLNAYSKLIRERLPLPWKYCPHCGAKMEEKDDEH